MGNPHTLRQAIQRLEPQPEKGDRPYPSVDGPKNRWIVRSRVGGGFLWTKQTWKAPSDTAVARQRDGIWVWVEPNINREGRSE